MEVCGTLSPEILQLADQMRQAVIDQQLDEARRFAEQIRDKRLILKESIDGTNRVEASQPAASASRGRSQERQGSS